MSIRHFLIGCGVVTLWAQNPDWKVTEQWLTPQGDTIVRERQAAEWWVGVGIGSSGVGYFGRLRLPRIADMPERGILEFRHGIGAGASVWVQGEWSPARQHWGAVLRLVPWETWRGSSRFEPVGSSTGEQYEVEVYGWSFLLSASARYAPGLGAGTVWEGLHGIVGVDARFLWNAWERVRQVFRNTERVEEWHLLREQPLPMWLGVHVGVGIDIPVTLWGERMRSFMTPLLMVQTGLPLQRTWGSTWTPVAVRAGLSVKLGWDQLHEYRRPKDTSSQLFLAQGAELQRELPWSAEKEQLVPIPLLVGAEGSTTVGTAPPASGAQTPIPQRVVIVPGRVQRFSYPTPTAVGLTPELRSYLDALVDYLRANPGVEVRIVGHTDEFGGTLEETQRISEQRAQQVVEYLVQRGISRSRLFASGMGARQPIADNRTPQGRLQNRRVEIMVVQ